MPFPFGNMNVFSRTSITGTDIDREAFVSGKPISLIDCGNLTLNQTFRSNTNISFDGCFGGAKWGVGEYLGYGFGKALQFVETYALFKILQKNNNSGTGLFSGLGNGLFNNTSTLGSGGFAIDSTYMGGTYTPTEGQIKFTKPGSTTTTTTDTTATTTTTTAADPKADPKADGKKTGNILWNAVNDHNTKADGTQGDAQNYSGVFASSTSTYLENGATLKEGDTTRKQWHKGSATDANEQDYKDAVKIGVAKGSVTDADKQDADTGAPMYFTMTDYRSGNMYTFKLVKGNNGKLQYKIDKDHSDLSKDDTTKYNGHNWEFVDSVESLVFDVNVDTNSHEIKLSYNGGPVALDTLVRDKTK